MHGSTLRTPEMKKWDKGQFLNLAEYIRKQMAVFSLIVRQQSYYLPSEIAITISKIIPDMLKSGSLF